MLKRLKWKEEQDKILLSLIPKNKKKINWEEISQKINQKNIAKTAKQCRERYHHQLDPNLKKKKFTTEENKKLFSLNKKLGSKWKQIALNFKGRTDNCIKNNFFSLIRKSLRDASKVLGNSCNSLLINQIRPKILADFLKVDLRVDFGVGSKSGFGVGSESGFGVGSESGFGERSEVVSMSGLVRRFCFFKEESVSERDLFVIRKSLDFLKDLNFEYLEMKRKKIRKLKARKSFKVVRKEVLEFENENFRKFDFLNREVIYLDGVRMDFKNNFDLQKKKKKIFVDNFFAMSKVYKEIGEFYHNLNQEGFDQIIDYKTKCHFSKNKNSVISPISDTQSSLIFENLMKDFSSKKMKNLITKNNNNIKKEKGFINFIVDSNKNNLVDSYNKDRNCFELDKFTEKEKFIEKFGNKIFLKKEFETFKKL